MFHVEKKYHNSSFDLFKRENSIFAQKNPKIYNCFAMAKNERGSFDTSIKSEILLYPVHFQYKLKKGRFHL